MAKRKGKKFLVATIRLDESMTPAMMLSRVCELTGFSASKAVSIALNALSMEASESGKGLAFYDRTIAEAKRIRDIRKEADAAVRDVSKMSNAAVRKQIGDMLRVMKDKPAAKMKRPSEAPAERPAESPAAD